MSMSPRQQAIAASLGKGGGRPVQLADPGETTSDRPAFSPATVALTIGRVWEWVNTGTEPAGGREPDFGWLAVEQFLRMTFAGPADPPAVNATQLADMVRATFFRAGGANPEIALAQLAPREFASWRAAAIHGYNCVLCDLEGLRQTSLAERERMIVAQAIATIPPG
jgi:hypothetical protein